MIEAIAQVAAAATPAQSPGGVTAGYGVSFTDLGRFDHAVYKAEMVLQMQPVPEIPVALQVIGKPLDTLNMQMQGLVDFARIMKESTTLSQGDLVVMSAKVTEFGFCSTVLHTCATKASDGISQLFRQQG